MSVERRRTGSRARGIPSRTLGALTRCLPDSFAGDLQGIAPGLRHRPHSHEGCGGGLVDGKQGHAARCIRNRPKAPEETQVFSRLAASSGFPAEIDRVSTACQHYVLSDVSPRCPVERMAGLSLRFRNLLSRRAETGGHGHHGWLCVEVSQRFSQLLFLCWSV